MQAKVHLITCHNDMAKNIVKAVERCGLKVDQLIFAGLASSYSVLTEDERERVFCVVDIVVVQWISPFIPVGHCATRR